MTSAYRVETVLTEDGKLLIEGLPFRAGERVEITVIEHQASSPDTNEFPLQGTVLYYDDPFEPAVPSEDWEALR
jgi:hypothetical protein